MSTPTKTALGTVVWHDHMSSDAATAQRFYGELLGWGTEVFKQGDMDYQMISKQGQTHGGFGPVPQGAPNHWVGHVLVDDADAAAERARKAGGKVVFGPEDIPTIGRFAIIMDPQGAVISAFAPTGDAQTPQGVFGWDELHTTDLEAAKKFYSQVFGWTAKESDMGGMPYVLFSDGETDRAGATGRMPGDSSPPHWLIYLITDDVDASTAKVKQLGGQIYMEPMSMEGIGRFSIGADPTGAAFGLFQTP
jgi:predicted enzyme related to lactoylglutathione lyase